MQEGGSARDRAKAPWTAALLRRSATSSRQPPKPRRSADFTDGTDGTEREPVSVAKERKDRQGRLHLNSHRGPTEDTESAEGREGGHGWWIGMKGARTLSAPSEWDQPWNHGGTESTKGERVGRCCAGAVVSAVGGSSDPADGWGMVLDAGFARRTRSSRRHTANPRPRAAPWIAAGSCRFAVTAALLRGGGRWLRESGSRAARSPKAPRRQEGHQISHPLRLGALA